MTFSREKKRKKKKKKKPATNKQIKTNQPNKNKTKQKRKEERISTPTEPQYVVHRCPSCYYDNSGRLANKMTKSFRAIFSEWLP